MRSQVYVLSSSTSPTFVSFLITISLVSLVFITLAFFCIIIFLLLALFLASCNVLLDWILRGSTASRNRQNDQNPVSSRPWMNIFWIEIWKNVIWGNQGGLEILEPRLDHVIMLPPPMKYKIHVRTTSCSNDECVICLDKFLDGENCRIFPMCKHIFHLDCIDNWLNNHATCPICRQCVSMCENNELDAAQHSWHDC
ncbi:putative transcription factor C2H2 family [Lupinus albus]|uniref:Putative transcription factor C2H2 family n=1 Tax=Lupinus albus TaxID=3870 RepID=A0A6A4MZX2_LUPAL|nr:putative transcription factor C2H2 family [Lupinus albus]